jgi:aminoglycoside phosphotransferase family enzyme/predicted kinase
MSAVPDTLPLPLDPAAFGQTSGQVSLVQTHIGYVYLIGELAFKLKKPVKFDFLDFTTVEKRHWACQREVELNRRLCPDLYLALLPVVERNRRRQIEFGANSQDKVIDWAVQMRRMPEERMLDQLLSRGEVSLNDATRIGDTLADFYQRQRAQKFDARGNGSLKVVRFNVEENLGEGKSLDRTVLTEGALKFIAARARYFLDKYGGLIGARERDGFVVDGHGDLRAENINLPENGTPLLFDCIEFNDRFRIVDSALDVAFLAMDFDSRGREDLSVALLARYAERCDPKIHPKLLNFYLGYRAFIKGKVAAWIAADPNVSAQQKTKSVEQSRMLFDLAVRYALRDEPALLVFCGPAGSGKSTLATELARRLKCTHLSTDRVRDELIPRGAPVEQRYAADVSSRVYEVLYERAAQALGRGETVILDGTFTTPERRKNAADVAAQCGAKALLVWADAAAGTIDQHLDERARSGQTHGSEAGAAVSRQQQASFVAPDNAETIAHGGRFQSVCRIDASAMLAQSCKALWNDVLETLSER